MPQITPEKLIWQETSPAPYESGWSIFAKLIALNSLIPSQLNHLISYPESGQRTSKQLLYKNGNWIDFDKFGSLLNVDPFRLRLGYLDNLISSPLINYSDNNFKFCSKCLELGYHNVFFQLGFIEICPWHEQELVFCRLCHKAIYKKGLDEDILGDENGNRSIWRSSCSHIYLDDRLVGKSNHLSVAQTLEIEKKSKELLVWLRRVNKFPELAKKVLIDSFPEEDSEFHNIYFNLAESLVGKCPWPLNHIRYPIRLISWNVDEPNDEVNEKLNIYDIQRRSKSSVWGIAYRAIRRYLFRRYVKFHRSCWSEFINIHPIDLHHLDGDNVCQISLAYATWRLVNENSCILDSLKHKEFRNLQLSMFAPKGFDQDLTIKIYCRLLIAQFFLILQNINLRSKKQKFGICFGRSSNKDYFPILKNEYSFCLLIPDPNFIFQQAVHNCKGRDRNKWSMVFPRPQFSEYFEMNTYNDNISSRIIFRLNLYSARGRHYFMNF